MSNPQESRKSDDEIIEDLKKFAKQSDGMMGSIMKRISDDLDFVGGNQYDDNDIAIRGPGRAKVVFNLTRNYCNQEANRFRTKPYGITLAARTDEATSKSSLTQGLIRGIESKGNALSARCVAIDRLYKAGRGYTVLTSDYVSNSGWDQEIKFQQVIRPDMVIWDPYSVEIDGEDATKCAFVEHVSKDRARNLTGLDIPEYGRQDSLLGGTRWSAPDDSVELITYFILERKKSRIYKDAEGNEVPSDTKVRKNAKGLTSRETYKTSVCVYKICNKEVCSYTELPLSRLPVVPYLGEMIDVAKKVDHVGLVYFARDPAKLVNDMASLTKERIALSPKATQYVDGRSIANYKDIWQQANKLSLPYLPYDSVDQLTGLPLPAPQPRDVRVEIGDVTSAQAVYQSNLAAVLGIPESGIMQDGSANETAAAVLSRSKSADLSNFQYLDNAAKSIKAEGRVLLEMLGVIYDTERLVPFQDENGVTMKNLNVSELGIIASEFEVDVDAGPLQATNRKEELQSLIALAGMLGPDVALAFASDIVRNAEFENSESIARKIDSVAKAKGIAVDESAEGEDPEALKIMQQADETISQLQGDVDAANSYIQQLQAELQSSKDMVQAQITVENIKSQNRLEVEAMKGETKLNEVQLKLLADAEQASKQAQVELVKQQRELANQPITIVQGGKPDYDAVGGMRNKPF